MRKHQTDKGIFIATFILVLVGTIMISIVGPSYTNIQNVAYGTNEDPDSTLRSQIFFVALSFLAMVFFMRLPLRDLMDGKKKIQRGMGKCLNILPELLMWGSLLICLVMWIGSLVKLPIVECRLGACRWISFGPMQIQPAELVKFGALFYFAKICTECRAVRGFEKAKKRPEEERRIIRNSSRLVDNRISYRNEGRARGFGAKTVSARSKGWQKIVGLWLLFRKKKDGKVFWVKFLVPLGIAVFFIVIAQKDLGSALPLMAIAFSILLVSGANLRSILIVIGVGLVLSGVAMIKSPHRLERLKAFMGESNSSYHVNNSLIAIGSGGLFGVGIGNTVQTAGYLPESITDSMFAVICETIGFAGAVVVLYFYWMLLSRILKVADCTKSNFYQLVAVGIFAWIAGHVVVNITAMLGLVPLTGITLPLLSKGGTSLLMNMAIIGLVLNISQYTMRAEIMDVERRVQK